MIRTLDELIQIYENCPNCKNCIYNKSNDKKIICDNDNKRSDTLYYLRDLRERIKFFQKSIDEIEEKKKQIQIIYENNIKEYNKQKKEIENIKQIETSLIEEKAKIKENKPITWEELKSMIGKPVWLEYDNRGIEILSNPHQWVIVGMVDNTSVMPEINFIGKWKTFWMQKEFMGKHWNAYKKERN